MSNLPRPCVICGRWHRSADERLEDAKRFLERSEEIHAYLELNMANMTSAEIQAAFDESDDMLVAGFATLAEDGVFDVDGRERMP